MKKISTIGILLVAVLAAVTFFYTQKKLSIDSILPAQPLAYVNATDIEKRLTDFQRTKLWKNIIKIDTARLMEQSGVDAKEIDKYKEISNGVTSVLTNPLFTKIFGKEVAVALYSPVKSDDALQGSVSGILLVTRLKPEAKFIEFVSSMYAKMNKKINVTQEQYKGFTITSVETDKRICISYTQIKDLLVVGINKSYVTSCIDVASHSAPSLSLDTDYREVVTKFFKPSQTMLYLNIQVCAKHLIRSAEKFMSHTASMRDRSKLDKALTDAEKFGGFKRLGFCMSYGDITKSKFIVLYDKSKLEPLLAKTYSTEPVTNTTIKFIPRDAIWYQWYSFNPKTVWDSLINKASSRMPDSRPTPSDMIRGIEGSLGVSFEKDIIASLGNEAGNVLTDVDLNGPFPVPAVMFFVKVNKKAAIENIVNSAIEKNGFSTSVEDYKGKKIKYAVLPFGENLQPGFCFLENYLLIATSHKVLKGAIDAWENTSESISVDKDFQSVSPAKASKANATHFLRTSVLLGKCKGIGDWALGLVTFVSSSAKSYQNAAQLSIKNLKDAIADLETRLQELKNKEDALKEEIKNLSISQGTAAAKKSELESVEKETRSLNQLLLDKQAELANNSRNQFKYARNELSPKLLKLYLDELAYPIIEGLKIIKATGSVTTFKDGMIESDLYISTAR